MAVGVTCMALARALQGNMKPLDILRSVAGDKGAVL